MRGRADRSPRRRKIALAALDLWGAHRVATAIAQSYGTTLDAVLGVSTSRNTARARHHLWAVLRHTLDLSTPELGRAFGVDHTTVLDAVGNFERALAAAYRGVP